MSGARFHGIILSLLLSFGVFALQPPAIEAAQRTRKKSAATSRKRARNVAPPRRVFVPRDYTLSGTGLQPRPNVTLTDPVMGRLRAVARTFAASPSPIHRQELIRFADNQRGHAAGALAYLALGYSGVQANENSDALKYLRAGSHTANPVPDYFEYYIAVALQRLKQHRDAIDALAGFEQRHPHSSLMAPAVLARAESLIETGQSGLAAELLKSRLGALHRPEADMLLARAYDAVRNYPAAVEAFRQVYYMYPAAEEADTAAKEIARLSAHAAVPPASVALRHERAARLFDRRRFRDAQEAYRDLAAAAQGAERELALVRAAASAYHARNTSAAVRELNRLNVGSPQADAERLYYLAECYRRMSRETYFINTVEMLGQRYPTSAAYEDALFSAGNYFLLERNPGRYVQYYRALYERFPSGDNARLAHWRVAWQAYRSGNEENARQLFEEHILRFPRSTQVAAALYWLGRLAEEGQLQLPVAQAYLRKAADHYPSYFYGTLAAQKLNGAGVARPVAAPLPENVVQVLAAVPTFRPSLNGAPPPSDLALHRKKVEALEAAWLLDLAVIELRHTTEDVTHSQYLLLELARLERDRGKFLQAIELIRRVFPNYFAFQTSDLERNWWELLFPLPWWPEVQAHAKRRGLDPFLVAALIRQESAFNPWAVSRANAHGLMQLLPSTARTMARKVGRPRPGIASLYDPETNIDLGTQYLRDVLDRYDGRLELALASYNAGPHRADAWLAAADYREVAEFIESIPFTETREYVQAVMRNAVIYRRLYGTPEFKR